MCDLDLETATVWRETVRIVLHPKKPRTCAGCGALIPGGEPFVDHFDVFEREATTEAGCFACWWTREVFGDAHGQYTNFSALAQTLMDCIGENDDEEDVWRDHLAALYWRLKNSPRRQRRRAQHA